MKVGVVDIGTLKVKCLIVEVGESGGSLPVYQSNTLTCLGVRMAENNNYPLPEYLRQTIDELIRCKEVLNTHRVDKLRVVSTHALREMGQIGLDIAADIKSQVGFAVDIITADEEADLFYKAVLGDFKTDQDFTIVDVGGGSVQILIGNKHQLKHKFLLKMGTSYLHDHFCTGHSGSDFPTCEEIRRMQDYILKQLAPIPAKISTPVIYGSSCVIDVFKVLGLNMRKYYLSKAHPYRVNTSDMQNFLDAVIPVSYDEREKKYPFGQKYMWGIDKAFLNILSICSKENSPFVIPSNSNINQGLVLSLVNS